MGAGGPAKTRHTLYSVEEQLGVAAVNWVTRVTRRIAPWVLGLIVFLLALTSPNESPIDATAGAYAESEVDFVVLGGAAAVCGLVSMLARKWLWPLLLVTALTWTFLSVYPTVMVSCYYAAIHLTRRKHAITFLLVATALIGAPIGIGLGLQNDLSSGLLLPVVAVALLVGLPYAIGLWVNARRQVISGLHERAARLEQEHAARADQARAEERARIAREMHDVVAHRVALMVLHAGALEVNAPDERLANEASLIRTTGREALTELRQVLGVLRTHGEPEAALVPQPDLSDLERLLDQARAAGLPVKLVEEGPEIHLSLVVQRTAYRIIQEALTNVVKHAAGAETVVTLRYLSHAVELKVDNGPSLRSIEKLPGSGLGLIGLRERVALLYGRLEARARLDGGFTVTVVLPNDKEAIA